MKQTKQNEKSKYLLQIPKPSHNFKVIFKSLILAIALLGGVLFFIKIMIPWVFNIVDLLLDLFKLCSMMIENGIKEIKNTLLIIGFEMTCNNCICYKKWYGNRINFLNKLKEELNK